MHHVINVPLEMWTAEEDIKGRVKILSDSEWGDEVHKTVTSSINLIDFRSNSL